MKLPLTFKRVKNHFAYRWWMYPALIAACVLSLNLYFNVSHAKPAENEHVECIVYGTGNRDVMAYWLETWRQTEFDDPKLSREEFLKENGYPQQEVFECSFVSQDTAGDQAMTIRVGFGGEGDLLILPRDMFRNYAESGLLMSLDSLGSVTRACRENGVAPEKGRWKGPDDVTRLYGIPVGELKMLNEIMYGTGSESCLCIRTHNENETVTEKLMGSIIRDMHELPATEPAKGE